MLVSHLPLDIWTEIILNFDVDLSADRQALQNIALCCRDLSYLSYEVLFEEVTYWWLELLGPWFTDGARCNARVKNLTIQQHPVNGSCYFLAWHIDFSCMLKNLSGLQGLQIGNYQDIFPYLQLACMDVSLDILAIPFVFPSLEAISLEFIQFQDYPYKDHAIFHKLIHTHILMYYHFMGVIPSAWLANSTRLDQLYLEVDTSHIKAVCKIFSGCSLMKLRLLTITLHGAGLKGIPKEWFWYLGWSVGMAINLNHILEICVQIALPALMGASVFYHFFTGFGNCLLAHIKCASKKLIYKGINTLPPLVN
ncbi:hypothetical protein ARMSODRAFT_977846 [Armillaria solidipes]|uniref:F-box domain-containing protein n=1 Tax=Armillaria solidipes TaxID=1076256 RepID=A0A2H3B5S9_9AGAR|nr:hypothetical protein ARMSODRAFT_977846 [Armillaria solidipes]